MCFPPAHLCALHVSPWQRAQFYGRVSPEDTQGLEAAERDCQKRGAGEAVRKWDDTGEDDWKPKFGNFFQGEYGIFPINFLTAKVSTFQSTVRLYILPSTL